MSATRRAAQAAVRRAARLREEGDQRPMYAIIKTVDPLTAELTGTRLVIDDDDLVLCQNVRIYDRDIGLRVGDALVVTEMRNDDWVATAVVSDQAV